MSICLVEAVQLQVVWVPVVHAKKPGPKKDTIPGRQKFSMPFRQLSPAIVKPT